MLTHPFAALLAVLLVAPAISSVPADPAAPGVLRVAPGTQVIPDNYVVTLAGRANGAGPVARLAAELTGRHGGSVHHVYGVALHGFSARMTAAQAAAMAADPRVAQVEPDTVVRVEGTQTSAPGNLDRIDQRALPLSTTYTYQSAGEGVNVYVLDTGIRITHQDFGGRARHGYDFVDDDTDASDCNGHGTHVAGTIGGLTWGVAKGVTLHAVRVLGCGGTGSNSGVIAGIDWVTANAVKPAVANMSLGNAPLPAMDAAVRNSIASGVSYVVSGGNSGADACGQTPARVAEAITVGNSTNSDARYTGTGPSNFGPCLDLFAPGTGVVSAGIDLDTSTATKTGTSMAAPAVAGAAALYLAANPAAAPAAVHNALIGCATTGVITNAGTGSPNRLLYVPCGVVTTPGAYENPADLPIPDWSTVHSAITVSGRTGNAPAALKLTVVIRHPYRGDVALDLVAPDGTVYPVKPALISDLADDIDIQFTIDASAEVANGEWKLRIQDSYGFDTGLLDRWSLSF